MELLHVCPFVCHNPARELISAMEKLGILEEITGYKRNRLFAFRKYLTIFADHSRQSKRVVQQDL